MSTRITALLLLFLTIVLSSPSPAHALEETQVSHPAIPGLETRTVSETLHVHYPARYQAEADFLIELVPTIRQQLEVDFPREALPETWIYLLPDISTYFRARDVPVLSPHWASGLALSHENVILIRLKATPGGRVELDRTLKHELSHIALRNYTHLQPLPRWFVEGVALVQSEPWTMERAQSMIDAGMADSLIPLNQLDEELTSGRVSLAYAESAHIMRWLFNEFGREHLRGFIERLHQKQTFEQAFEATYGESLASVEARWHESLDAGGGWFTLLMGSATLFFLLSVFAGFMLWRVRTRRVRELARLPEPGPSRPSDQKIPEHLREFGPFTGQ